MSMLYDWQKACLERIKDQNAIVSAPTSAGKTKVAYIWMDPLGAKEGKHRIIYTVPMKALANEKTDELIELYGKDLVGIETGDIKRRENAPILVCTQEIYTRKHARRQENIKLVIDEFHYIFSAEDRARAYIEGIARAQESHQILIMSATLGNPWKVRDYLLRATGKDFSLFETEFRPTKLTITDKVFRVEEIPPHSLVYVLNTNSIDRLVRYMTAKLPPLPLLKRRKIKLLAENYRVNLERFPEVFSGVAKYHARLTYTEKRFIERLVREGFIHTCFATNALGVGVNLPFQWVLFGGLRLPNSGGGKARYMSKTDFLQLAGRAGRKGFFEEGFVGFLLHGFNPYEDMEESIKEYAKMKDKPLEEPRIVLKVDVEAIVKGERTLEQEYEYIMRFSEPPPDREELKAELEKIRKELSSLGERELKFLKKFYMSDMNLWGNIKLCKSVLSVPVREHTEEGKKRKIRIITPREVSFVDTLEKEDIKSLLLQRRILKNLHMRTFERVYMHCAEGIEELEREIEVIDPLLLEVGR